MVATGRWKRAHMPDVSLACALAFHALFGAVHEASHLAAAWWTGRLVGVETITDTANVVAKAMLGRHVVVAADVSDGRIALDLPPGRLGRTPPRRAAFLRRAPARARRGR